MEKKTFSFKTKGRYCIIVVVCIFLLTTSMTQTMGVSFTENLKEKELLSSEPADNTEEDAVLNSVGISVETMRDVTRITYELSGFYKQKTVIDGKSYYSIHVGEESQMKQKGLPDMADIRRSILVDDTAKMNIRVTYSDFEVYDNILIAPSKGYITRDINPSDVPFEFDSFYNQDRWYPRDVAELSKPYIIRDFRGTVVVVNPFQYNPIQKQLRFYNEITVEVYPDGEDTINCIYREKLPSKVDFEFNEIYKGHFINYQTSLNRYTPVSDQGKMLVITYDSFYDNMVPFVQWKNMKGIPTEMVNISDIGTTASAIDSYIDQYYQQDNELTFVLLVGDIDQMPSLSAAGGASDPSYTYILGDDHYPDLFIGRFSANNDGELDTQIERTLEYEKALFTSTDWLDAGTGIASNQGVGDEGEYDWEHMRKIRNILLNFTYNTVDELYDGDHGGEDDPDYVTVSDVSTALNEGRSMINYCGHGSATSWSTSDFSNSDINNLVNNNMLPFIWSVACSNGDFDGYTACFGEAWLRATNNGEPTGGIACFASSIGQYWDPPMDGQDEMNDILTETYTDNIKRTYGGISFNGCMHMNDNYPWSGNDGGYDMTDTWHIFGDPSLEVRTDAPTQLSVDHAEAIIGGSTSYEVDVQGVSGALCAVSYNYNLLGYAYTDETGHAEILFAEPISDIYTVDFVVTAFNKEPYITELSVIYQRQPAEFESMEGVLIRSPFGISYDIIAEMSEDVDVVTIVGSSSEQSTVEAAYTSHGVNMANTRFLIAPSDSYWTRDYGPWFVYNVDNELEVVDFTYNRDRPNDNALPAAFATNEGLTYNYMDIVHTGGNYMTDGQGISISTTLVETENPSMTVEDIQAVVADNLGIQTYHLYEDVLGDYIEHIDCWAKYLSPDTIMIIEVPSTSGIYADVEAAVTYFSNQISCYGTQYTIERIYTPGGEPYINSLILNDKVFVPIDGTEWDDDAIQSYEDAMPGYEVIGFSGSWETTDALHCRAKGIPDRGMLYIHHKPLPNGFPGTNGFEVKARIVPISGETLIAETVTVNWKLDSTDWSSVEMISLGDDYYKAYIPPLPSGETVYYYIHAEDSSGRAANHPYVGEFDPHTFEITPVPDIWYTPESYYIQTPSELILEEALTIGNEDWAGMQLNYNIEYTNSGGWLSIAPVSGSISVGTSSDITLTLDTQGLGIGEYSETIYLTSNDPDEPSFEIPIDLIIVLANDVGVQSVDSPSGVNPPGTYNIQATMRNYGSADQTNVLTNCSIYEGGVDTTIMYEDFSTSPSDWTITHVDGTAWSWDSSEQQMENSYGFPNAGYLDSPLINCFGKHGISLSYWQYWNADYSSGNQDGYVRGSIDGGATYPFLIDEFHHNDPAEETAVKQYDLSWADNQQEVRIRFDVYNDNDWYWYVDDFNISSELSGDILYSSETTVDLQAYEIKQIQFSPAWDALPGTYGIKVATLLPGDQATSNDQSSTSVYVIAADDAGVTSINSPTGVQRPGYHTISATVANFGSVEQEIPVNVNIYNSLEALVFSTSASPVIPALDQIDIDFVPDWYVTEADEYRIEVSTALTGDSQPNNDLADIFVLIQPFTDVGCTDVIYPTGVIQPGEIYVSASLENFGGQGETIPVLCKVYEDSSVVFSALESFYIPAISTDTIEFITPWDAIPGEYTIEVVTVLFGDEDETNNASSSSSSVIAGNDACVVSIDYPTGSQKPGLHTIEATIGNVGSFGNDIPVNCEIYDETLTTVFTTDTSIYLDALSSGVVVFTPDWLASDAGDYTVSISTHLVDEENPVDDSLETTVTIISYTDAGAVIINEPSGEINEGSCPISATVENFGNSEQLVTVNCSIFSGSLGYYESFENSDGGYFHAGTLDLWEWGTPTHIEGPGSAYSGDYCWGINLDGSYINYTNCTLESIPLPLPSEIPVQMSFWQWYITEPRYDGGNVKISTDGGTTWGLLGSYQNPYNEDAASNGNPAIPDEPCFSGRDQQFWEQITFDLTAYAGEVIILRWHFGSDRSIIESGWYIDDVEISTIRSSDAVYTCETEVLIPALSTAPVEFTPSWQAEPGNYGIMVKTQLPGDEDTSNDQTISLVNVVEAPYICGDANDDGSVNVGDAVFIINYVFKGGPAPDPLCIGDANGDGDLNVGDGVYLVNYVFKGGPPPVEGCCS